MLAKHGLSLSAGLVVGAGLRIRSDRVTRFETRADGLYHQPNVYLGLMLSPILLARIAWRLIEGPADESTEWTVAEFMRNPSTMLMYGFFAGHFLACSLALMYWACRSKCATLSPPEASLPA